MCCETFPASFQSERFARTVTGQVNAKSFTIKHDNRKESEMSDEEIKIVIMEVCWWKR